MSQKAVAKRSDVLLYLVAEVVMINRTREDAFARVSLAKSGCLCYDDHGGTATQEFVEALRQYVYEWADQLDQALATRAKNGVPTCDVCGYIGATADTCEGPHEDVELPTEQHWTPETGWIL